MLPLRCMLLLKSLSLSLPLPLSRGTIDGLIDSKMRTIQTTQSWRGILDRYGVEKAGARTEKNPTINNAEHASRRIDRRIRNARSEWMDEFLIEHRLLESSRSVPLYVSQTVVSTFGV